MRAPMSPEQLDALRPQNKPASQAPETATHFAHRTATALEVVQRLEQAERKIAFLEKALGYPAPE